MSCGSEPKLGPTRLGARMRSRRCIPSTKKPIELYYRMMAIPATMQSGRSAKVRALLTHVMGYKWRGPDRELEWDVSQARMLFAEFAGMTAEDVANV